MNKFCDIRQGSLLDDLNFLRKVQNTKNRLEREFPGDFHLNPKSTDYGRFSTHPQSIEEDSDTSSEGSSVKRMSASTSRSNVNIELDNYQENKLKIKNARRELQEKVMQEKTADAYNLDIDDDSCTVTPVNTFRNRTREAFVDQRMNKTHSSVSQKFVTISKCASQKNIMSESVFERKFKIFVEKSLHTISDIRNLLEKGIDPPDGDEDISRRQLRVKEFSNRFSRNYLYPIVRQTFRLNAELTLQKIEDHFTAISTESMLKSTTTKISLPHYRNDQNMNKKNRSKNNIEERLSMYSATSSFRKDPTWKKAVEALAKKKLSVKSRYKTALYKHRPPLEKPGTQIIAVQSKCRLYAKKSSMIFKRTPVTTPVNEDDIETMVEVEKNKQENVEKSDENKTEMMNHDEIVVKLLQLVLDNNQYGEQNENDEERLRSDKKIAEMLEKLRKGGNVEILHMILEKLQKARSCEENLELKVVASLESATEGNFEKRKEPTITVTGVKNAKLICIRDDNPIIETKDDEVDLENKDYQTEKRIPLKSISSSQTQTEYNNNKTDKSTQRPATSISMKRLTKSSKCLEMLPKNLAVNIIQYKLDFHKHCKSIPIYRRTANILPWKLMGKISDEILDVAILSIAKEIEVNDIVDRIYQSELQL
ncbi:uncharacterized protein isoform X2 [Leptinotarsa decemlineata]|uniref:uncharacterized protein isoform X2 n=1 Tax=Leptinotarsa decemlineata TaxID=7539 RepID=UPI003D308FF3